MAKKSKTASRGSVNNIILESLMSGDKYGYEIIKEVELKSNGKIIIKQPSLYSSLKRFEVKNFITSYWGDSDIGGRRHYYTITPAGREYYLEKNGEYKINDNDDVEDNQIDDDEPTLSIQGNEEEQNDYENYSFINNDIDDNQNNENDNQNNENDNQFDENDNLFDENDNDDIDELLNDRDNDDNVKTYNYSSKYNNFDVSNKMDQLLNEEQDDLYSDNYADITDEDMQSEYHDEYSDNYEQNDNNDDQYDYDENNQNESEHIEQIKHFNPFDDQSEVEDLSIQSSLFADSQQNENIQYNDQPVEIDQDIIEQIKNTQQQIKDFQNANSVEPKNEIPLINEQPLEYMDFEAKKQMLYNQKQDNNYQAPTTPSYENNTPHLNINDFDEIDNYNNMQSPTEKQSIIQKTTNINKNTNTVKSSFDLMDVPIEQRSKNNKAFLERFDNLTREKNYVVSDDYKDKLNLLMNNERVVNNQQSFINNIEDDNQNDTTSNNNLDNDVIETTDEIFDDSDNEQMDDNSTTYNDVDDNDYTINDDTDSSMDSIIDDSQQIDDYHKDTNNEQQSNEVYFNNSNQSNSTDSSTLNTKYTLKTNKTKNENNSNNYLLINKVKFVFGILMLFLLAAQVAGAIYALYIKNLIFENQYWVITLACVAICLTVVWFCFPIIKSPNRYSSYHIKFSHSLMFAVLAFLVSVIFTISINTILGLTLENLKYFLTTLIIPIILAFNFIVGCIIFQLLTIAKIFK